MSKWLLMHVGYCWVKSELFVLVRWEIQLSTLVWPFRTILLLLSSFSVLFYKSKHIDKNHIIGVFSCKWLNMRIIFFMIIKIC